MTAPTPPSDRRHALLASAAVAATLGGAALAAAFGAVAVLRGRRPLHPDGVAYAAVVDRRGATTGVPWLDEPGPSQVTVRVSRATGLPPSLPDIYGMAVRIPLGTPAGDGAAAAARDGSAAADDGAAGARAAAGSHAPPPAYPDPGLGGRCADLLFASTGHTAYGRFVLRLRPAPGAGPLTTLLPVRTPIGPVLLRLAPVGRPPAGPFSVPDSMRLSYAVGTGRWVDVGTLTFADRLPRLDGERHDPIVDELPGTRQYDVVRRLREPAYRAARRIRPHG